MKRPFENLNKVFDNRARLTIMSVLVVSDAVDFNALKQMLGLTDGNLASHVSVLERQRYVRVRKEFIGRKTQTSYSATDSGRKAFAEHVDALERIIRGKR